MFLVGWSTVRVTTSAPASCIGRHVPQGNVTQSVLHAGCGDEREEARARGFLLAWFHECSPSSASGDRATDHTIRYDTWAGYNSTWKYFKVTLARALMAGGREVRFLHERTAVRLLESGRLI